MFVCVSGCVCMYMLHIFFLLYIKFLAKFNIFFFINTLQDGFFFTHSHNKGSKNMSKRKISWDKMNDPWKSDASYPDPRINSWQFVVSARKEHEDLNDEYPPLPEYEETHCFKTMKAAYNCYKKAISRTEIIECDIEMILVPGGAYHPPKHFIPRNREFRSWVVRWREDGAFLESYHDSGMKFRERVDPSYDPEDPECQPGLKSHWVQKYKEEEKEQKRKKIKKNCAL